MLSGSKQVRSWSPTNFEPGSVMEFGFYLPSHTASLAVPKYTAVASSRFWWQYWRWSAGEVEPFLRSPAV